MNIHSQEYEDINDELLYHFNEEFEKYSRNRKISFEDLMIIIKNYGYNPTIYEINDLKGEIGEYSDKIYFFVIMKRVVNQFYTNKQKENFLEAFQIINKSKSGFITKDELTEYFLKYGTLHLDQIDEMFDSLDTNHDNRISLEEFENFLVYKK